MKKSLFRNIMLISGILVAIVVVVLINAAFLTMQSPQMEQPAHAMNELVHYSIPNLLVIFF